MKKIILVSVAALLFSTVAVAQSPTAANKLFLNAELSGLSLGFTPEPFELGLSAGGGYFVIDNLAVRALVGLDIIGGQDGFDGATLFAIGAGARYYLKGFFLEALLLGANTAFNDEGERTMELGIQGAVGYSVFLNEHIALEPSITFGTGFSEGSQFSMGLNAAFSVYF
ncbi:MAG: hypothetical protein LBF90_04755 [Prevotellaceae bacterium]|jgi:hypothetical protein|nr:hypothetical protein [Prevotellaceae bacterium]